MATTPAAKKGTAGENTIEYVISTQQEYVNRRINNSILATRDSTPNVLDLKLGDMPETDKNYLASVEHKDETNANC